MLPCAQAADISLVGNWTKVIDSNDLAAGAGSDLSSPIRSSTALATIDITNTHGKRWTVRVSKSDINWPDGVDLAVRRTSDGTGAGTIWSGDTYLTLTGTRQVFFGGTDDRSGIQLQMKTQNLSVKDAPDIYSTTLNYRIRVSK